MALPVFRSVGAILIGNGSGNLTTNITLGKPAGTVDGDYIFALLNIPGTHVVSSVPSGWTLLYDSGNLGGTGRFRLYGKVASGEPASWTWGMGDQVAFYACYAISYGGVHPSTSYEGLTSAVASGANGTPVTQSLTTTGVDRLVVGFAFQRGGNAPIPTWSWNVGTERVDSGGSGPGLATAVDDIDKPTAGAQSITATIASSGSTNDLALVLLALMPAVVLVGKSLAMPSSMTGAVGRSVALPWITNMPRGRSLALPYNQGGWVGRSLAQPYVVIQPRGKSLVLPYNKIAFVGRSAALPYVVKLLRGKSLVQVYSIAQVGSITGRQASDGYNDGASDPFGPSEIIGLNLTMFATFVTDWSALDDHETDLYYARLPFEEAQGIFRLGSPDELTTRHTELGWHGTLTDPETGSFLIVREGGPFEDLLGKRVRITRRDRLRALSVYAVCHEKFDVIEEVSVPRRLYLALGIPPEEDIPVTLEVMKPGG